MRKDIDLFYKQVNCQQSWKNNTERKIEIVPLFKYLGIIVDGKLKWDNQIVSLQNKLRKATFALYHLNNISNKTVVKQAYHALAESYLRYGITAWGYSVNAKKLQQTQNRLLKIIYNKTPSNNTPNTQININSKILKITDLYRLTMINTYYEEKKYLVQLDHEHNTRRKKD